MLSLNRISSASPNPALLLNGVAWLSLAHTTCIRQSALGSCSKAYERGGQILWHKQCFATIYSRQRTLSAPVALMTLWLTVNIYSLTFQSRLRQNACWERSTWHKVICKRLSKRSIGY